MRRILLRVLFTVAPLVSPASAHAQARPYQVIRIDSAAIDSALKSITSTPTDFARELATGDKHQYQLVVASRSATGPAEVHEEWSDIIFVRSGTAVLQTGTRLLERKPAEKGEWRGTAITDASDQVTRSGDVLIIPAGIAHQWLPKGDSPFAYVILKVHLARPVR